MPLPKPKPNESRSEFISRCISDDKMIIEYRDKGQRSAICYVQWKNK